MNRAVTDWIDECVALCRPDRVVWCDGSEEEKERLTQEALGTGELELLSQKTLPGCVHHRTALNDVARTENLTFICTNEQDTAGPMNNWMPPAEAYQKAGDIFRDSMKGRTMYVVPFIMGLPGSPFNKIGIELTDSIYVVLNMRIMTRMGKVAVDELGESDNFTRCLHGKAELDLDRRLIMHFPEDNTIWSVGSGYGGNVLLGKKCLSLRIASYLARNEGWLAEHMLIVGIESPDGEINYVAGAFPSACGKTNLAMLIPPKSLEGYKVWTVGDDIAWMRIGEDGRLWAVNPENGFFGVLPGTNYKSNPNAIYTIKRNSIFTNVLMRPDNTVWWEGMDGPVPESGIDWKGEPWTPAKGEPGANPNSRFTAPVSQCPCVSPKFEDPQGVPISAILFGGRRTRVAPLIYQSFDWQHGVFVGSQMASERTAAQYGKQGEVRRDPMAMLPFAGYNMGDYLGHWLNMGRRISDPPKIFHVNWFRTGPDGKFLWPGFGENLRALLWAIERSKGGGEAIETPVGYVPASGGLDTTGLDLPPEILEELLEIDREDWAAEVELQKAHFERLGARLPREIGEEHQALAKRLGL